MGGEINSLRSDKFPLFFHFSHRITGWLQAGIPDWLAAPRQGHSPPASWFSRSSVTEQVLAAVNAEFGASQFVTRKPI